MWGRICGSGAVSSGAGVPDSVLLMCRSIHRLRDGRTIDNREAMEEAARQYVRKVSGFGKPAKHNEAVFDAAVAEITDATERLMDNLTIR